MRKLYNSDLLLRWCLLNYLPAMTVGGFLFGVMNCQGCEGAPLGRVFIGLVSAILTPLSFGFPPRDESGSSPPYNAWPYVFPVLCLLAVRTAVINKWRRPKDDSR